MCVIFSYAEISFATDALHGDRCYLNREKAFLTANSNNGTKKFCPQNSNRISSHTIFSCVPLFHF